MVLVASVSVVFSYIVLIPLSSFQWGIFICQIGRETK